MGTLICWSAIIVMVWCIYLVLKPIRDRDFIAKTFSAMRVLSFFIVIWTAHVSFLTDMWWMLVLGFIMGITISTASCNEAQIKGVNKVLFFFLSIGIIICIISGTVASLYVQLIGI